MGDAPQSAPDVVTCEEARVLVFYVRDQDDRDRLLRFINQAEAQSVATRKEIGRLRAACAKALVDLEHDDDVLAAVKTLRRAREAK